MPVARARTGPSAQSFCGCGRLYRVSPSSAQGRLPAWRRLPACDPPLQCNAEGRQECLPYAKECLPSAQGSLFYAEGACPTRSPGDASDKAPLLRRGGTPVPPAVSPGGPKMASDVTGSRALFNPGRAVSARPPATPQPAPISPPWCPPPPWGRLPACSLVSEMGEGKPEARLIHLWRSLLPGSASAPSESPLPLRRPSLAFLRQQPGGRLSTQSDTPSTAPSGVPRPGFPPASPPGL